MNYTKKDISIPSYRPPNEGMEKSILLQFTKGCPWDKCTFCPLNKFYRDIRFEIRGVEEIKRDIRIYREFLEKSKEPDKPKTVFIGDSDSLIMKTSQLVELLRYLYQQIPQIERVTTYARTATLVRKPLDELKEIREAGLDRLHRGLETGYDILLKLVNKGVTTEDAINGGLKAKEAGYELSEYVILGLGGKKMTEPHAELTAEALNKIKPDFIRFRTLIPQRNTILYYDYLLGGRGEGWFRLLTPYETLREAKNIIEKLNIDVTLFFDHHSNPTGLAGREYKIPGMKEVALKHIEDKLKKPEPRFNEEEFLDQSL
jgi:radical SAM superfamily enzyme YgiQ (UPF0313 family)